MILLNIRVAILSYVPKSAVFLRDFYFCAKKEGRTGLQMWKDGLLPLIALKKSRIYSIIELVKIKKSFIKKENKYD